MRIEIRPQSDTDTAQVRAVITAAFGDGGRVADLAEALRARTDTQASLVAVDRGAVVGHVHLSISWVDAADRLVEVLALSPLSVTPDHQSKGIGGELLRAAQAEAARLTAPLVFLEGDPAYYARHGWQPAESLGFVRPSLRVPACAFQVVATGEDIGPAPGAFVYNDTFWAHDSVGLRPAQSS